MTFVFSVQSPFLKSGKMSLTFFINLYFSAIPSIFHAPYFNTSALKFCIPPKIQTHSSSKQNNTVLFKLNLLFCIVHTISLVFHFVSLSTFSPEYLCHPPFNQSRICSGSKILFFWLRLFIVSFELLFLSSIYLLPGR